MVRNGIRNSLGRPYSGDAGWTAWRRRWSRLHPLELNFLSQVSQTLIRSGEKCDHLLMSLNHCLLMIRCHFLVQQRMRQWNPNHQATLQANTSKRKLRVRKYTNASNQISKHIVYKRKICLDSSSAHKIKCSKHMCIKHAQRNWSTKEINRTHGDLSPCSQWSRSDTLRRGLPARTRRTWFPRCGLARPWAACSGRPHGGSSGGRAASPTRSAGPPRPPPSPRRGRTTCGSEGQ
jgi:hypothetical protein